MIYILVGRMCSGKTTIAKEMEKMGVKRIVTYTTRPKRSDEIDGKDYYFISEKEFQDKMEAGFFAEVTFYHAAFGDCYYGSALQDYISEEDRVVVLNPYGVKNVRKKVPEAKVIWISCNDDAVKLRAGIRGDSKKEVKRRIQADKQDFEWFGRYEPRLWDLEIASNATGRKYGRDIAKAIRKKYNFYNER